MSTENQILICPIVSLDGTHVFSSSDNYAKLVDYFNHDSFVSLVTGRELDKQLLAEISEGLTNHIRSSKQFDWSKTAVAVVSRAVVDPVDDNTHKAVFEVAVLSEYKTQ